MKTIEEHNAEQLEIERLKRQEEDDCPPADACQSPEPENTGSRYKRGRRWWEQSKWERRR
jgi:hypothetical protein